MKRMVLAFLLGLALNQSLLNCSHIKVMPGSLPECREQLTACLVDIDRLFSACDQYRQRAIELEALCR